MPEPKNTAPFILKTGECMVTRDQIFQAMTEFDRKGLRDREGVGDNRKGWSIEEHGKRYNPKWVLKLATNIGLTKFTHKQARETLDALGFELHSDPDWKCKEAEVHPPVTGDDEAEEAEEADELTFDRERDLQTALRANIGQLETGLKITDGGKEKKVEYAGKEQTIELGSIDITAEDRGGATVVIELKAGKAGRRAIGQTLGYMGALASDNVHVRGILVAEEFSPQAVAAARVVPGLQLRQYRYKFAFEIIGAA